MPNAVRIAASRLWSAIATASGSAVGDAVHAEIIRIIIINKISDFLFTLNTLTENQTKLKGKLKGIIARAWN